MMIKRIEKQQKKNTFVLYKIMWFFFSSLLYRFRNLDLEKVCKWDKTIFGLTAHNDRYISNKK